MKIVFSLMLLFTLTLRPIEASERIDRIIHEDAMETIQQIFLKKVELQKNRKILENVSEKIDAAKNGERISIKVRKIGATLTIIAIVIGSYKAHFPLGMRFLLSSYLSMSGAGIGLIKLSHGDIQKVTSDLTKALTQIQIIEKDLNRQIADLCEEDGRHKLCYMTIRK